MSVYSLAGEVILMTHAPLKESPPPNNKTRSLSLSVAQVNKAGIKTRL